jgi:cation/acetate symporter
MSRPFAQRLHRIFGLYTVGLVGFVLGLALLDRAGLPPAWTGFICLLVPVALYAGIGIVGRTADADEYYVAGRRVPALYNGMAMAADWLSAASFIGLAGTLYFAGYGGLAYVMGWTGGFCLVAWLLAPYLRQFGQYTIPDFLGARYEGHLPRVIGAAAAILCSFTYVVAQIYGVGLITTRLTGVTFEIGIFLGLGGILVCSFLGGMRAVTWTQVAQCILLLGAYLVPVVWLSVRLTGVPVPQVAYAQALQRVAMAEDRLLHDPSEQQVTAAFAARARADEARLRDVRAALQAERAQARDEVARRIAGNAPQVDIQAAEWALAQLPKTPAAAQARWAQDQQDNTQRARPLGGMPRLALPSDDPSAARNFIALVFCLMLGTAGLPHILTRSYTAPTVAQARRSVAWALSFILLLYLSAPVLAALVKLDIFSTLVGTRFDQLPAWVAQWARVDGGALLSVADVNGDGRLQLGEIRMNPDMLVLAAPEIGGLPYFVSGLVAAGGMAAALSTADGLLLTISNALSHDLYFKLIDPRAPVTLRVTMSKLVLMIVALCAAYVAAQRPGDILFLVAAAFSFAASAFFPALVLGIFWKRANHWGASLGMLAGLGLTVYYMATTQPWLRGLSGVTGPVSLWWGIQPVSAGVFGVPLGFAVTVLVSLATRAPGPEARALVDAMRQPPAA